MRYYYYICKNKECKFKVPANEIENAVLVRIKELSTNDGIMADIITKTNNRLQTNLPQLLERKQLLEKELAEIKNSANVLLDKLPLLSDSSASFLEEKLKELSKRRDEIETGIIKVEAMIQETEKDAINKEIVMEALSKFSFNFDRLEPYQQKDLIRILIHKIIISEAEMKIGLYGQPSYITLSSICEPGKKNSQVSNWLPGPDSNQRQGG